MQCPACGKTGFVTISSKRFCTSCGAKLGGSATSATPGSNMSGIGTGAKMLDLRTQKPAELPAGAAAASTTAPGAAQLHGRQGGGAVLDLRATPAAQAAPTLAAAPTPPPTQPAPQPAPQTPAVAAPKPAPVSITAPVSKPVTPPAIKPIRPMATPTPAPDPAAASTTAPVAATPQPPAAQSAVTVPRSNRISKFTPRPDAPKQSAGPALPPAVASQVEAMGNQAGSASAPAAPQSPALQQALAAAKESAKPSVVKIGAALAAVGVMVAVVWLQNSPKLAFRSAAAKAGINASLPTYVPSSYHQSGGVSVGQGQLTLNFTSPSTSNPLTITQRQSTWDANSLRDNYVSQQTENYLAVQGEGLTIYMFGNQANWINHGVWYQLSGTAQLSRDQITKIAYGL